MNILCCPFEQVNKSFGKLLTSLKRQTSSFVKDVLVLHHAKRHVTHGTCRKRAG